MIYSKNFLVCGLICLTACSSPKKETAGAADSTKIDSIAREVTAMDVDDEGGATFEVDPSIVSETLTIYGQSGPMIYWLNKVYGPDRWINIDTGAANYKIKTADLTEGKFSSKDGKCVKRFVLLTQREMPGEQYYDVHFIYEGADGKLASDKVSFEGDIAQSTGSVSLSTEYKLSDDCPVLAVSSESEGGDIGTVKTKTISFFISAETGMKLVFDLMLENTQTEYRASPQDDEKSTSEIRDFEILDQKTNGFRDIKVHITNKKDGSITGGKDAVFRFNGEKYSE